MTIHSAQSLPASFAPGTSSYILSVISDGEQQAHRLKRISEVSEALQSGAPHDPSHLRSRYQAEAYAVRHVCHLFHAYGNITSGAQPSDNGVGSLQ